MDVFCLVYAYGGSAGSAHGCVFPFTFVGNKYMRCIREHYGEPWCSRTDDYDRDKQWGYCQREG